jgi:rhamnulokinase
MTTVAAVDIGATSGRVMVAEFDPSGPRLVEVARFPNHPVQAAGRWTWDARRLHSAMIDGLVVAREHGVVAAGIDTWALDYGVLRDGELIGPVYAYRDPHHERGVPALRTRLPWEQQYGITGIQDMPINTIYQIASEDPARIGEGTTVLLVPDLLTYWTTGALATDVTNASSTGMLDPRTRTWSPVILAALGLPSSSFLAPDEPGRSRGEARDPRLLGLPIVGVATHDTASAFAGTPILDRDAALVVSLGTWALVGAEAVGVEPNHRAAELNVTHELGVDGTVRLLRNATGMWLLEECRRAWAAEDGFESTVEDLLAAAVSAPAFAAVFDVDAPGLGRPGQSASTIAPHLRGTWDGSRGAMVRAILESLVIRIAERALQVESLLGRERPTIHVVGGASRMSVLMQWLADATGRRVVAGPVEATALGNAVEQWRALGIVGSLAEARAAIGRMPEIAVYEPVGSAEPWVSLAGRLIDGPPSSLEESP